jgi:hypothetical protein
MRFVATLCLVLGLWAADDAQAATRVWPCQDQDGFSNITLTVVNTIKPAYGFTWSFSDAPSIVSDRLLADLNENSRGIIFKEANGVVPNLLINVMMTETNNGTRQDSAYSDVSGLGKAGTLFHETSGQAPYTTWRDAIDHLATRMLNWFQNGWQTNPPCRLPNGSMRKMSSREH